MKLSIRQYIGIILTIILFSCIIAVCSCTSTKNIDKAITSLQQIKSVNIDSLVTVSMDSVKKHYLEKLKNSEVDIVFDNNCDTVLKYRDTGSTKVINTIKYIPGKGIEASGRIKSFNLRESELLKQLDSMAVELESEARKREGVEIQLKDEQNRKTINKKTKVFNLWWLLFVGFIVGVVIESKYKLFQKAKSLFTKI